MWATSAWDERDGWEGRGARKGQQEGYEGAENYESKCTSAILPSPPSRRTSRTGPSSRTLVAPPAAGRHRERHSTGILSQYLEEGPRHAIEGRNQVGGKRQRAGPKSLGRLKSRVENTGLETMLTTGSDTRKDREDPEFQLELGDFSKCPEGVCRALGGPRFRMASHQIGHCDRVPAPVYERGPNDSPTPGLAVTSARKLGRNDAGVLGRSSQTAQTCLYPQEERHAEPTRTIWARGPDANSDSGTQLDLVQALTALRRTVGSLPPAGVFGSRHDFPTSAYSSGTGRSSRAPPPAKMDARATKSHSGRFGGLAVEKATEIRLKLMPPSGDRIPLGRGFLF